MIRAVLVNIEKQNGVALVIVLWMLILLTTIASTLVFTLRAEVNLSRADVSRAEGYALAKAGLNFALIQLVDPREETAWEPDGVAKKWSYKGHDIMITVTDETGKIDLNAAPIELLKKLYAAVGYEAAEQDRISAAIVDWRDRDDQHQVGGAEDSEYRADGFEYGAKDSEFSHISELLLVKGVGREAFEKTKVALTVDTHRKRVNQTYSPPLVLSALRGEAATNEDEASREEIRMRKSGFSGIYRITVEVPSEPGQSLRLEASAVKDRSSELGFRISGFNLGF